jgi:hypothetical protein
MKTILFVILLFLSTCTGYIVYDKTEVKGGIQYVLIKDSAYYYFLTDSTYFEVGQEISNQDIKKVPIIK